ncbi:39S ribosomal protein L42, mitochondrial isoform X2 [Microtus ochrogaster]|uniref:Large ribosomal subunit protein mL42 n=1 Tax=Microtus ochrogaster TaxID=79684 RepID=A0ABM1UE44_MICOH|nr:39S ribosomal protein L42, mitochondrial isoform X2 [Microtus ochrogaster]
MEPYLVFVESLPALLFPMTTTVPGNLIVSSDLRGHQEHTCKVELALTSDGRTIVCYHPSVDIPYEHTKPIPQPDILCNNEETHEQVLKTKLEIKSEKLEQGPMIEQLSKVFFTTKHRWYPHGQYHRRRKKPNPPRDR